jgi:hypothetical protein
MKKTKAAAGAAGWNFSISTRRPWNEEIEHISSGHFDTGRLFNGRPTDGVMDRPSPIRIDRKLGASTANNG